MNIWACVLLSLTFCPASFMPSPSPDAVVIDKELKDIPEINKGLNLMEGDIMEPTERSTILGNQYQWEIPVPYLLTASLSMNDKGVILRAFEQIRLKSCIDFKPRTTEGFYISVEKLNGCWSYVGRANINGQTVSIGNGCGYIHIVEHEFLHALGFYHEQSRYDRDDYVTINFTNIITASQYSFNKYSETVSSLQGTPYDYMSVMHYGKNSFSNDKGPTIITKQPEFQDVIGQRLDMSEYDAFELNSLYKCNSFTSFLGACSFDDESLCGMHVCSSTEHGWQRVRSVGGVNVTDHTYLGKEPKGSSFFMHFSTADRNEGDSARLESREMTPTRDCKVQCLQFYYYHSGNEFDQLNIWIREYQNQTDSRGTLRIMDQITGRPGNYWRLHHTPLNASKSFQVEFEAQKGAGNSSGGFSLDDINISQTECPQIWQIRNFKNTTAASFIYSPLYYSSEGYRYQVFLQNLTTTYAISVRLVSGVFDEQLQWPCVFRQVTFQFLDQNAHMQKRMSFEMSITTNSALTSDGRYVWDNPRNNRNQTIVGNETVFVGTHVPTSLNKDNLIKWNREFIKGGDMIVLISMQNISGLLLSNSVSCPNVKVMHINASVNESARQGPCVPRVLITAAPIQSSSGRTFPSSLISLLGLCLLLLNLS